MPRPKVVIIPARPDPSGRDRIRTDDPRYVEGQRDANRGAAELLSEHVRTQFRMSDSPLRSGAGW
jgi:hypothetical protein